MKDRIASTFLVAAVILLVVMSCTVNLTGFLVPPVVATGGVFEAVVTGNHYPTIPPSSNNEHAAVVLQIPNGVKLLDATNDLIFGMVRDDPKVLALYKAEPGHNLVAFSGFYGSAGPNGGSATVRYRLLAPTSGKAFVLKVSLAAQTSLTWVINDPAGISDFTRISARPHAATVTLAPNPWTGVPIFQDDNNGLPFGWESTFMPSTWTGLAVGDVNGDGNDDITSLCRSHKVPGVFLHTPRGKPWVLSAQGFQSYSVGDREEVAFGDFNRDGNLDLVSANGGAWLGDGGTSWKTATGIKLHATMEGVASADVNNDGYDDVAFSGEKVDIIQVFLSDGKGGFTEASQGLPGGGSSSGNSKLLLKDVSGDGNVDVVWTRFAAPGVWLGNGTGDWTQIPVNGILAYDNHLGLDAADLDGDGDPDLVLGIENAGGNPTFSGFAVYENTGGARWKFRWGETAQGSGGAYLDVALADFDRDGRIDVLAGRADSLEIWQNVAPFQFKRRTISSLPASGVGSPEAVAVGDFNGDTFPDVAVTTRKYGISVWLNELTGFSRFGRGCGGSLPSTPAMGFSGGQPRLGNRTFAFTLDKAPPSRSALLVMGLDKRRCFGAPVLPLDLGPFGAPGCSLLVEPRIVLPTGTDHQGRVTMAMPIPAFTSLLGTVFFAQWGVVDARANRLGLAVSEGGAAKIGR